MLRSSVLLAASAYIAGAAATLQSCLQAANVPFVDNASGSAYISAIRPFNNRLWYSPVAVVQPTNTQGVAAAVKCGVANKSFINARSGGHSYANSGNGGENNHLIIDLAKMKAISINGESATIQAGNRLGEVATALNAKGRALPHGTCQYVGLGGHASYGGWGFFSRAWGMTLDTVTSMEVVTATGAILTASATQNSDLYWALRGAGGSYGIVTSFNFKTQAAPANVVTGNYDWNDVTPAQASSIILQYQTFGRSHAPAALGTGLELRKGSKAGVLKLHIGAIYIGNADTFTNSVMPVLLNQLPKPSKTELVNKNWIDTLAFLAGGSIDTSKPDTPDAFFAKSIMTPSDQLLTSSAVTYWTNYLANTGFSSGSGDWFIQVELYGGANSAINAIDPTATAFVHRKRLFNIQLYASNHASTFPQSTIDFMNGAADSLIQSMGGANWNWQAYQNYIDPSLATDVAQSKYWGVNFPRLQQIKAKYDPNNVFKTIPAQAIVGSTAARKARLA